jgi:hypothetical protein
MDELTEKAAQRLRTAMHILADLKLLERWEAYGEPILVGALAYGLLVRPDIDMEIYCHQPRVADGFAVMQACAQNPHVRRARFANELEGPDQGLYFQLRYRHECGELWKIDMWMVSHEHPGPCAADLVEPMKRALTDETRRAILEIKEGLLQEEPDLASASLHIYRAVLDDGVRDLPAFMEWRRKNATAGLLDWRPGVKLV